MPKYNQNFILNPAEIDLIEAAVREQSTRLSEASVAENAQGISEPEKNIKALHALLGKLHNKKIWWGQVHHTGMPIG